MTAKLISQWFKDKPLTPAATVEFWSEYVLRHRKPFPWTPSIHER